MAVQRSSPSIGDLAAALAKAQPELTIRSEVAGGSSRAFAMRRSGAGLRSYARPWGSIRLPRCRPPRSTGLCSRPHDTDEQDLTPREAKRNPQWPPQRWPQYRDTARSEGGQAAVLASEASGELRDRLLAVPQFGRTASLGEKNRLIALDSQRVEEAFQAKLAIWLPFPLQTP
jgi:hypothetical protein